ncbi:MAG TPA: sialidase family protein [Candidatus Hydrogenedentes bacterium]|nr:sialidase family protein [Candidatus Hydrogenedentota bacterium]
MHVTGEGIVFSGADDASSATFPMVCVTSTGRWLCAFRAAPGKLRNAGERVLLIWSDDRGRTWHDPIEPFYPPRIDDKPGTLRICCITALPDGSLLAAVNWVDASNPALPYFNETTEGLLDTRILISRSHDDGGTWSPLQIVDTTPFNVPTPLTGPILRLSNGDLVCQFELNKPYTDLAPWKHASVMIFSRDGGKTWPRCAVTAQDPAASIFYWDQRPAVLPDGRILDLFWTFDRRNSVYLDIHASCAEPSGLTWPPPQSTGVSGQPGPVFSLSDDSIAMPYVDRAGPPVIKVCRSIDGGRNWNTSDSLVVYESSGRVQTIQKSSMQDAWSEMYAFSVGLPNVAPLPEGGSVLVYYAGLKTDETGIRWALIQ